MTSSLPNQPNWHYNANGQQVGPVSESEILSLINSGVVVASTLVWHEGMTDWLPANQSTLSKLFSGFTPPAPPPLPADLRSGEKQTVVINSTPTVRGKAHVFWWTVGILIVYNLVRLLLKLR